MPTASYFCQNCKALYQIVKVEAGPQTADREAEADIAHAKDGTEILDCLHVMETGMRYFFMRAQAARNVKGNEAVVRANMLEAVNIAEKIAPYRHHRLGAIKLDKDPITPGL